MQGKSIVVVDAVRIGSPAESLGIKPGWTETRRIRRYIQGLTKFNAYYKNEQDKSWWRLVILFKDSILFGLSKKKPGLNKLEHSCDILTCNLAVCDS